MAKTVSALTKSYNLIFGLIELLNLLTLSRLLILHTCSILLRSKLFKREKILIVMHLHFVLSCEYVTIRIF
jgi:hypothetical protein